MSTKRMQVLLDDEEFARVREDASRHGMTVSDWVRHALRRVRRSQAEASIEAKFEAIDAAMRHDHPTADIDEMLEHIEQGYTGG